MLSVSLCVLLLSAASAVLADDAGRRSADSNARVDSNEVATQSSSSSSSSSESESESTQPRVTFLDKARECESKCEGKRHALPECDLFCIDEPCFNRVFGSINLMGGGRPAYNLDDPKKLEAFTRCAKLRLLPAIPDAMRTKKALKDEQKRQMDDWRARMEQRRVAMLEERAVQFEAQKAERAKLADDKAEKRRRAEDASASGSPATKPDANSKDEL